MSARIRRKSQLSIAREGFLDRRSKRCFWLLLSPQTKVARAGARNYPCAADNSEGRGAGTLVVFGDYQIAPIAARSTAMGRWRLTPPWYGDAACGRDRRRKAPHPSRLRRATCLPAGRSAGLTGHRRVIQHRGPPRGKAFFARGRFFWLCLSLFGGAGQPGQGQERQGGVEGYAGVGGLGGTLGIVGLSIGGRVVVIAAGGGRGPHGIQRQRHF